MTLLAILLGTLAAGIGSVWLAAWLSFGIVSRYTQHMLSLAAGALLATAFLHLLPEAFDAGVEPHNLFMTLLFGLLFFFLLDKAELWHHGHEHHHGDAHHDHDHHEAHDHDHDHEHSTASVASHVEGAHAKPLAGGWAILAGDSVHCFGRWCPDCLCLHSRFEVRRGGGFGGFGPRSASSHGRFGGAAPGLPKPANSRLESLSGGCHYGLGGIGWLRVARPTAWRFALHAGHC
jgi:hypothetical protein